MNTKTIAIKLWIASVVMRWLGFPLTFDLRRGRTDYVRKGYPGIRVARSNDHREIVAAADPAKLKDAGDYYIDVHASALLFFLEGTYVKQSPRRKGPVQLDAFPPEGEPPPKGHIGNPIPIEPVKRVPLAALAGDAKPSTLEAFEAGIEAMESERAINQSD